MKRSNRLRLTTDSVRIRRIERAARRYLLALERRAVPSRADGDVVRQVSRYRRAAELVEYRSAGIRQILDARGVSVIRYLAYRNFGLHLDKLVREYGGETLRIRAADAVLRWTCYGCDPEVLRAICEQVFSMALP